MFKKTSRKLDRKQNLKLGVKHNAVPSPRECLVVLALQTKLKAPPNWNLKQYKSVELYVKPSVFSML